MEGAEVDRRAGDARLRDEKECALTYVKRQQLREAALLLPSFQQVPPSLRERLLENMTHLALPARATVYRAGDTDHRLFVVLAGSLAVMAPPSPPGQFVCALQPGDSFGARALVGGTARGTDVVCATDVSLAVLRREDYERELGAFRAGARRMSVPAARTAVPRPAGEAKRAAAECLETHGRRRTDVQLDAVAKVLRAHPAFGALDDVCDAWRTLAREASLVHVSAGSALVRQGEPTGAGGTFFLVLSGSLSLHRRPRAGASRAAAGLEADVGPCRDLATPGDLCGHAELRGSRLWRRAWGIATAGRARHSSSSDDDDDDDDDGGKDDIDDENDEEADQREEATIGRSARGGSAVAREDSTLVAVPIRAVLRLLRREAESRLLAGYANVRRVLSLPPDRRTVADVAAVARALRHLKFFAPLPQPTVRRLCASMALRRLPAGSLVLAQGVLTMGFHVIFSGGVSIHVRTAAEVGGGGGGEGGGSGEGADDGEPAAEGGRGGAFDAPVASPGDKWPTLDPLALEDAFGRCVVQLREGASFGEQSIIKGVAPSATVLCHTESEMLVIGPEAYKSTFGLRAVKVISRVGRVAQLLRVPPGRRSADDVNQLVDCLKSIDFFYDMPLTVRRFAAQNFVLDRADADTVIYQQGDKAEHLFIVLRGSVATYGRRLAGAEELDAEDEAAAVEEDGSGGRGADAEGHGSHGRHRHHHGATKGHRRLRSMFVRRNSAREGTGSATSASGGAPDGVGASQRKSSRASRTMHRRQSTMVRRDEAARGGPAPLVLRSAAGSAGSEDAEFEEDLRQMYGPRQAVAGPGSVFGAAELAENTRRQTTLITRCDTEFITLSRIGFLRTVRRTKKSGNGQQEAWAAFLRGVGPLRQLSRIAMLRLVYYLEERRLTRGETVARQGDPPGPLHVVVSGELALSRVVTVQEGERPHALPQEEGRRTLDVRWPGGGGAVRAHLSTLGCGEVVGLASIERRPQPYTAAVVSDEARVLVVPRRVAVGGQIPRAALAMLRAAGRQRAELHRERTMLVVSQFLGTARPTPAAAAAAASAAAASPRAGVPAPAPRSPRTPPPVRDSDASPRPPTPAAAPPHEANDRPARARADGPEHELVEGVQLEVGDAAGAPAAPRGQPARGHGQSVSRQGRFLDVALDEGDEVLAQLEARREAQAARERSSTTMRYIQKQARLFPAAQAASNIKRILGQGGFEVPPGPPPGTAGPVYHPPRAAGRHGGGKRPSAARSRSLARLVGRHTARQARREATGLLMRSQSAAVLQARLGGGAARRPRASGPTGTLPPGLRGVPVKWAAKARAAAALPRLVLPRAPADEPATAAGPAIALPDAPAERSPAVAAPLPTTPARFSVEVRVRGK